MRLEVIAMLKYLAAAFGSLLTRASQAPIEHGRLQHAHWDRGARRWVTHEEVCDFAQAA